MFTSQGSLVRIQYRPLDLNASSRVHSARQLVYGDKRVNPKGRLPDDTWILHPQDIPESFQADEDTWYFPRVNGTFKERKGWHGCQMPEQLLGRIIRACSNPQEVVLDPCTGSGTTLAVAKKLDRQYIGFELSKEYAANAQSRLKETDVGHPLDGVENPLTSAPTTAAGRKLEDRNKRMSKVARKVPAFRTVAEKSQLSQGENQKIVISAFRSIHCGFSTDCLIANPELHAAFIVSCRKSRTEADETELNKLSRSKIGKRRSTSFRVPNLAGCLN